MPLLLLKRHMATMGASHEVSVFAKLCSGRALSCSSNAHGCCSDRLNASQLFDAGITVRLEGNALEIAQCDSING